MEIIFISDLSSVLELGNIPVWRFSRDVLFLIQKLVIKIANLL